MNIFVTVGTTPFDTLIEAIDTFNFKERLNITMQISTGKYVPKNYKFFDFTERINEYYEQANIVVTHAGAGSIYNLLEKGKKIIIVPNLDRIDKHQDEISNYVYKNNYGKVCYSIKEIGENIEKLIECNIDLEKYTKVDFFCTKMIEEIIDIEYN